MAEHLFRHSKSTIGTTTPTNIVKSSISVSVSKMPASNKIRSTSFSGPEKLQLRKSDEMPLYNYARERLEICNFGLLDN